MDFRDSAEEEEFRLGLRRWLTANVSEDDDDETPAGFATRARAWQQRLYAAGYAGLSWPVEYGGRGLDSGYEAILNEEAGNVGAPALPAIVNYLGRSVYTYGTEAQKTRFLRPLLSGDEQWCQGFSEPGAGSDLAALTTSARCNDEEFVIRGQKTWTSLAQYADWCFLLARTESDVPKHRGISCLLVPMTTRGITVRPIVLANGAPETCEVFFDDVVVPVDALLGARGRDGVSR